MIALGRPDEPVVNTQHVAVTWCESGWKLVECHPTFKETRQRRTNSLAFSRQFAVKYFEAIQYNSTYLTIITARA